MLFEQRELNPYAEPVAAGDLKQGETYFIVQFIDDDLRIPLVEPIVFLGRDLRAGDEAVMYFQDAASYREGMRLDSATNDESAGFYAQPEDQLDHIFEFERALDVLMNCSLRRRRLT